MNNPDQIKLLLPLFAVQVPTLLVCFLAGAVILARWQECPKAAMWALLGFGLTTVLCFAVPIAQAAVQEWVRQSGHTAINGASLMTGIAMVWSVLRAITYGSLLVAVFAGRSRSASASMSA